MSGTVKRRLLGMLALGAALALAGSGCAGGSAGEDEDVVAAVQQLDSIDSDGDATGDEDAVDDDATTDDDAAIDEVLPGNETPEDDSSGPDPLPWSERMGTRSDNPSQPGPTPVTHGSSSTPSNGTGGK